MGYAKGFRHGLTVGLALGTLLAPRPGAQTREVWRRRLEDGVRRGRSLSQGLSQGWSSSQPVRELAAQTAGGLARAIQPMAQEAQERLMELAGRRDRSSLVDSALTRDGVAEEN